MSRTFNQSPFPLPDESLSCDDRQIAVAAGIIHSGGLIGLPTETVYGLAADATQGEAVAAIYEAKGRPAFNPLICHVADLDEAMQHGLFDRAAIRLAEAFWPGPLTLVAPFRPGSRVSDLARAGLDSIALRVPAHPMAQALLKQSGVPLAAPSANLSGRISPTSAKDVVAELGDKVDMVLDGGASAVGLESTIISCLDGRVALLRPGGVSREEIESVLGLPLDARADENAPRAPGMLESHYAPVAPVRLNMREFAETDAILAFGQGEFSALPRSYPMINLSPEGNLRQAAARLFSALRELDASNPAAISVSPIPMKGLGEAINDRLTRASAPRG